MLPLNIISNIRNVALENSTTLGIWFDIYIVDISSVLLCNFGLCNIMLWKRYVMWYSNKHFIVFSFQKYDLW